MNKQKYSISLLISCCVHGLLLIFLIVSYKAGTPLMSASTEKADIVQASIVDEKLVDAEVKRLESEQKEQKAEIEKAKEARKQREEEQVAVEKLKQELAQAKIQEEERLSEIKLAKENEQKQLEALRKEKEKEQKRLAALDEERQAEQDRVKAMRLEREKEEKRKEQLKKVAEAKKKLAEEQRLAAAALNAQKLAAEQESRIMSEAEKILMEWGDRVRSNKREALELSPDLLCTLLVSLLPDGNVKEIRVLKTSGNGAYDDLAIHAVYKSQPFNMPEELAVRDQVKTFELGVRNVEES